MPVLKNRAKMSTSTTGTGTITLGSAEDGYQTFSDAGVANSDVVRYIIEDGSNFEIGTGTYTSSGTTLSRTVIESSNSDAAINLSGSATVFIGATAEDIPSLSLTATASGALSNGQIVVVNSDGTVSPSHVTTTTSSGTVTTFESATIHQVHSALIDDSKVVVVYKDAGNSNYGTAIIGTISGTSISFGTPVVFESTGFSEGAVDANPTGNNCVIYWHDGSSFQKVIVGSVSGTSISFGTASTAFSSHSSGINSKQVCYDSNADKYVIASAESSNSTKFKVGTVSGTSISLGTEVSLSVGMGYMDCAFDDTNNKILYAWREQNTSLGSSTYGRAVIGTVSGTSISFGTIVDFTTSEINSFSPVGCVFAGGDKVFIAYETVSPQKGFGIVGSVSGTSITFGTAVEWADGNVGQPQLIYANNNVIAMVIFDGTSGTNSPQYRGITISGTTPTFGSGSTIVSGRAFDFSSLTYSPTEDKAVYSFRDFDASSHGKSVVITVGGTTVNLTATNYIGISDAAYSNGDTATVQIIGSIDDAQSGLTAGLQYYVQTDGSLGTSAASPSVLAGTAVSSTKLIVKG
tara:strand:- start:613 stop:2340 length:1728 start_codon:yes stop_codon:yes gene_type:complete